MSTNYLALNRDDVFNAIRRRRTLDLIRLYDNMWPGERASAVLAGN